MEALRERFGKYHVLEKIAQGGMAEVYKVKTVGIAGFEKIQALKRILPHSAREGRFIRSFIDEARIAVELTHRNIVQVFDFGKADGELFLAMELIEGKDLRTAMGQAVARDLMCPIPIAAYIISEVAAGLDYAHRKTDGYGGALGIVHCDVSPSNVMLSNDGYVKILDFGIARATFASALERRRLRGKPRYMAPEQTVGEPPTAAADVFALGIIAWELCTGLPLYRGADLKAILEAVRRTDAPRVDRLNPAVPKEMADALATALDREPSRRGTAADLMAACTRTAMAAGARSLSQWLADIEARPSGSIETWQADATSISVPDKAEALRQPTVSLAHVPVPPGDIGEGTPGPRVLEEVLPDRPTIRQIPPFERAPTPLPRTPRPDEPGWRPEALADHDLPVRPSYTEMLPVAGIATAIVRIDEPLPEPALPEETSFDELDVEPAANDVPAASEAIDDDLGVMTEAALTNRRRAVIVWGALEGGSRDVLRPVTRSLGELAYLRGGVVMQLDDEALLVAFGLEVAGEDDVAVAMGWALDASAMARDSGDALALKVGARTGVATMPSSDGTPRVPQDAIDDARTLAREAAPDRPLFVGSAGRLTSGLYTLRESSGRRRRSRVIEVVGPRGFDERDRARMERRGKFIGRTQQLAELDVWFQRAIAADRRLSVLVIGAAGTGKSRLVAELIARRLDAKSPVRVTSTAASPASRFAPFSLVIDLYQAALGLPPARGRSARAEVVQRLHYAMTQVGVPGERAREVGLDLDRAMELRDGVALAAPEVADLRPRISAGLAAFRAAMLDGPGSRRQPAITVIEDIHLADSASLEVLRHAFAIPAHGPELLVLTARPDSSPPPVDAVLTIADLVGSELRALIIDRLGDAATPLNIAAVIARGGGNPLFVEELAQAVREAGPAGEEVPASARDVVSARVDRVSAKARMAVRMASVLGGTMRARLLEELLGEESLASELDELVAAGILARPESAAGSTEGELAFARGLIREVVYDSLSARAQRESHARVGKLLASRFFAGREEPPAIIAEHLERGGELAGAAAFWLRAGRLAIAASDADAAIACFTRCLANDRELGATPSTPTSLVRRREALAGREEARRLQGDLGADPNDLDELQRLCEGDPARLADVALRRAQRMLRLGDYANASVATVVAEDHATAARDERLRGEALRIRGEILERLGRFDDALAAVGAARDLFARHGAVAEEMQAMVGRGRIHLMRAHYEAARDAYRPVLARIDKTGDPWLERVVKNHVAVIEMCLGNFAVAMASAERSLELCRRYGDRAREGDALSVDGIILLEVGLYDKAAVRFADALEILSRTASRWSRADCLIYAGTCDIRRGRANGLAFLDEALAEARELGARYLEANALIARAGAHLRRGSLDLAVEDAGAGTRVAREATLVGYEIQGLARHALALARKGGYLLEAGALVHAALSLFETQRVLEGSEEEVYAACVEVLTTAGADDRATAVKERGRAGYERKLAAMSDPEWRLAYSDLPEHRLLTR